MKSFDRLSIRSKLIRVILVVTAAVLVPTAAIFVIIDFVLVRQATARAVTVLANTVAYNSSAALAFQVRTEAAIILEAFRAEPNIQSAALFDAEKQLFVGYPRRSTTPVNTFPDIPAGRIHFSYDALQYLLPVVEGDAQLGWLYLRYNLNALRERLFVYALSILAVTLIALFVAYGLSRTFQARISKPIIALQQLAERISANHDYSVRATRASEDEIGSLTDSFNQMLNEISAKEVALRESEERLRFAVESSETGVWDWNMKAGEALWMGTIYEKLGFQASGRPEPVARFFRAIHPEDRNMVENRINKAYETREVFDADFRMLAPSGEMFHIRARGRAMPGNEVLATRMVGVIIDVSDLNRAHEKILDLNRNLELRVEERTAELRAALKEIEAFNYSVSHDLRRPLRAINGYSVALLDDYRPILDDAARNYLERIVVSCRRMSQIIDDLLELSRINKWKLTRMPVNLSELAQRSMQNLREAAPDRAVEVIIEDNLVVDGDPSLLTIALDNLLQNAWKFTSKKKTARIEFASQAVDGEVSYFVRDNGAGFDMAYADSLFGVFERLHKDSEFEGTGVGLATVRRIIERHGGTISGHGRVDGGATFRFTIPNSHSNKGTS